MMHRALPTVTAFLLMLAAMAASLHAAESGSFETRDPALAHARDYVEKSDRYLHHSRLQRGMKAYGLTTFAGTAIEKFDVEIVSVMKNFDPGQDVILATASGHGLETSMIVQGMSGSPVFVTDPRDGKDKMIGAVAYGWSFSKKPLCGIQPITQMLAMSGVLEDGEQGQRAKGRESGEVVIELDKKTLARYGLSIADVTRALPGNKTRHKTETQGDKVTIRLPNATADEIRGLGERLIPTRNGATVQLATIARIRLVPTAGTAAQPGAAKSPAGASRIARSRQAFLKTVLDPRRGGLERLYRPVRTMATAEDSALVPLATPLTVTGCRPAMLEVIRERLAHTGLVPVQGGGVGGADAADEQLQQVKLQPGGTLVVPYVTGDADWIGVGTVTEVIGNRVLGFGHGMDGEGSMTLPMGTGYVHAIVPLLTSSFKLGSSIRMVGTLDRDEYVGVGGKVGEVPAMIPMTVTVNQGQDGRTRTFNYQLLDHWYYTGRIAGILPMLSATALREPPMEHHVAYDIAIDFGDVGKYTASNLAGGYGLYEAGNDTELPLAAMMYNPLGEPVTPQRIDVSITVREGNIDATIIDARLDGEVYQPGDTVSGTVLLERFREDRTRLPFTLKLPDDLPDGDYPLTVSDAQMAMVLQQQDQPQRYNPRTPQQLFKAVQRVVQPKFNRLHLHLQVPAGGGLAIGQRSLPDLPPSKAAMLRSLNLPETWTTQGAVTASVESDYVINGSRTLTVTVKKHVNQTPVRK